MVDPIAHGFAGPDQVDVVVAVAVAEVLDVDHAVLDVGAGNARKQNLLFSESVE